MRNVMQTKTVEDSLWTSGPHTHTHMYNATPDLRWVTGAFAIVMILMVVVFLMIVLFYVMNQEDCMHPHSSVVGPLHTDRAHATVCDFEQPKDGGAKDRGFNNEHDDINPYHGHDGHMHDGAPRPVVTYVTVMDDGACDPGRCAECCRACPGKRGCPSCRRHFQHHQRAAIREGRDGGEFLCVKGYVCRVVFYMCFTELVK